MKPSEPDVHEKKVLMVSYSYPPVGTMGAVRATKFAKNLPAHGWRPTVLTVRSDTTKWGAGDAGSGILPGVKVVKAPFPNLLPGIRGLMEKLRLVEPLSPGVETRLRFSGPGEGGELGGLGQNVFQWLKQWLSFPDIYNIWVPFAVARGLFELTGGGYSAIFSTSPPFSDHIVAAALSRLTGLPLVLDYRDLFAENPFLQTAEGATCRAEKRLEARIVSCADAITAVSDPNALRLKETYGDRRCGVHFISSGFDPEDYPGEVEPLRDRFVITYAGMLYGEKRDPRTLIEVIHELIEEDEIGEDEVLLRYFGPDGRQLQVYLDELSHPGFIEINEVVSRSESIVKQRESSAILVVQWNHPFTREIYGGKIFEHLGARRPVIALTHPDGILAELVNTTGVGFAGFDRDRLKETLLQWIAEFRKNGALAYRCVEEEASKYRWEDLTGRLAGVLDRAAGVSGSRC